MSRLALALAAAGVAALLACSRPRPSPEYDQARQRWSALVQERGDDAAEDGRAEEVLALLARVPAESADAASAAELRARIEGERNARAEERARRDRLVAGAAAPPAMPPSSGGGTVAATPDAPERSHPVIAPGMKVEEFRAQAGDCFERRGAIQVGSADGGAPTPGEAWALREDAACQARHADAAAKLVVLAGGAVVAVAPASAARTVEVRQKVELGTLPDGGVGIRTDGGVVEPPPGARIVPDGAKDGGLP